MRREKSCGAEAGAGGIGLSSSVVGDVELLSCGVLTRTRVRLDDPRRVKLKSRGGINFADFKETEILSREFLCAPLNIFN